MSRVAKGSRKGRFRNIDRELGFASPDSLETVRGRISRHSVNRGHCIPDELAPRHLLLDVRQMKIGVQQKERVADRVNDI